MHKNAEANVKLVHKMILAVFAAGSELHIVVSIILCCVCGFRFCGVFQKDNVSNGIQEDKIYRYFV